MVDDTALDGVVVGDGATIERFDGYMERCLYGPGGFYATTGTAGRKGGDFITSPEVGPLFGAVLAEALDRWWEELGTPDPFRIYDVGCGPGRLLKAISVARPDRPWELIGVDRVETAGSTMTELPDDLTGAVVLGNELLDNLPFRVIDNTGDQPMEVFVTDRGDGPAQEVLESTDVGLAVPVGTRAPLLEGAAAWITSVLARSPSILCLFDYGERTTNELANRGNWLRTYRNHQRGSDPLIEPGSSDITTDIAWDQLPLPETLVRQSEQLRGWGIEELVEEGRTHWKAHAHAPDLLAMRMRSRISEAEALLDESGLGNWWAATWRNG